jgi:hypothetical protein
MEFRGIWEKGNLERLVGAPPVIAAWTVEA